MRGWALSRCIRGQQPSRIRFFSATASPRTPHTEHVRVPCASAGHVIVSLHDVARHPVSTPLVINLPACPAHDVADVDSYLPRFLHRYPTATIHYRWPGARRLVEPLPSSPPSPSPPPRGAAGAEEPPRRPLCWPTPIHDVLAGYDHLARALAPPPPPPPPAAPSAAADFDQAPGRPAPPRRDVFVVGSHLGGGLAAALAVTESRADEPVSVRGLLAANGVYNWTAFLPDHPVGVHRARLALDDRRLRLGLGLGRGALGDDGGDADLAPVARLVGRLFGGPACLFDPFASPALFFHTAGIMVPPGFGERWRPDHLASPTDDDVYFDPEDPPPPSPHPESESGTGNSSGSGSGPGKGKGKGSSRPPRPGFLDFPPRGSTLRIPDTLLLHATPPRLPTLPPTRGLKRKARAELVARLGNAENSFASQAAVLAGLMRRSVDKSELKGRRQWDGEAGDREGEAIERVGMMEAGRVDCRNGLGFGEVGEELARQWLEERLG